VFSGIRAFWSSLHRFVKPIQDAHTLYIPSPLIQSLEHLAQRIPGLKGSRFVVFHTLDVNYYRLRNANLKKRCDGFASIIGFEEPFPEKHALIGVPYSLAPTLFSNVLIAHEIGHFAFEEVSIADQLADKIDKALQEVFGERLRDMTESDRGWCVDRLRAWSEEIFCDRLAIALAGPVFSFAFLEFLDISGVSDPADEVQFAASHPSDACRFHAHLDQIKSQGWWERLRVAAPEITKTITWLSEIEPTKYVYADEQKAELAPKCLAAFLGLLPAIKEVVATTAAECTANYNDEVCLDLDAVSEALAQGVVPSTVVYKECVRRIEARGILNGAYFFYLCELDRLTRHVKSPDRDAVSLRAFWLEKIEMWTLKALEDDHLRWLKEEYGGTSAA
jgi:hypothetical protein